MDHDFDALVEASRMAHNKLGEHALWKAAFSLQEWYFVARGTGDDAEPLVGTLDGKSALLVFTDEERAAAFAKVRNMRRSDARGSDRGEAAMEGQVLSMDVPDAVDYCKELAKLGVEWAVFNSGGYAFQAAAAEIPELQRRFVGK